DNIALVEPRCSEQRLEISEDLSGLPLDALGERYTIRHRRAAQLTSSPCSRWRIRSPATRSRSTGGRLSVSITICAAFLPNCITWRDPILRRCRRQRHPSERAEIPHAP